MGEIISFYSYKGGVGRSMAVANVATLLAHYGRRVLVVDFDLEAPGLHRYFLDLEPSRKGKPRQKPTSGQRGTIDAFVELASRLSGGEKVQDAVTSILDSGRYGYSVSVRAPAAAAAAASSARTRPHASRAACSRCGGPACAPSASRSRWHSPAS